MNGPAVRTAAEQLAAGGHKAIAIVCDVTKGLSGEGDRGADSVGVRASGCAIQQRRRAEPGNGNHRRYAARGICINAVCPGTIETPMVTEMFAKNQKR